MYAKLMLLHFSFPTMNPLPCTIIFQECKNARQITSCNCCQANKSPHSVSQSQLITPLNLVQKYNTNQMNAKNLISMNDDSR